MPEADAAVTPRRSASAVVDTAPIAALQRVDRLRVVLYSGVRTLFLGLPRIKLWHA